MSNTRAPVIHRVTTLDLKLQAWSWPFAEERRDEIAAHFAAAQNARPRLWNGRVLLGRDPVFDGGRLRTAYFETDFASFLAWRDWGFPDPHIFNGFGMGALRASDGAFVLGEMGHHTANGGRIYFPSGTPDLDDIRGDTVDIAGSVMRELAEETGLTSADCRADPDWHCVYTGPALAMIRIIHSDLPGDALKARIEANLARESEPELSAIHLVWRRADLNAAMPRFVTAFLETQLADQMRPMGKKTATSLAAELTPFITPFRYDGTHECHLRSYPTAEKGGLDKDAGGKIIEANRKRLADAQEKLYAQDRWSLLLIFQGMDAAGKDSAIKSVFDGINPQGCEVTSFKQPSAKELDHDYMWRAMTALPERGHIGIFNRSYYEECLIVRVHPEVLAKQKLPKRLVTKNIWRERFEDITAFERYLSRNGTMILKFFLHVSKNEQRQRFLDRLEEPAKNWKFSMADISERALWPKYQAAYQDMIHHTATTDAPWHIVPADHKWFARVVIGSTIVAALEKLDLKFPEVDKAELSEFKRVRAALEAEAKGRAVPKK